MAKGQYLTSHQKSIVRRFYAHADTRTVTALQELVSDLALAEPGKADKLWKKAGDLLAKCKVEAAVVERSVGKRDVKAFAEVVGGIVAK